MKKQSNLFKKIITLIIIFTIMLSLSTCDLLKNIVDEPEVTLNSVELRDIHSNGVSLLCKVNIENTNSFAIPFPDTNWQLFLNSISFAEFKIKKDTDYEILTIGAKESTVIDFEVSLGFKEIFETFVSLIGNKKVNYKIILEVLVPVSKLDTTIPFIFEHEGEIPLLQIPILKTPSVNLGNVSIISGIEVFTSFKFENPNDFDLPAPKFEFDYKINNISVLDNGMVSKPLLKSETTIIDNKLEVKPLGAAYSFIQSMILGNELNHVLLYSCDFGLPIPGANIPNTEIIFK